MTIVVNVILVVVAAVGVVWALQGANIMGGSVMSGQSTWLYVGIALAIVGVAGLIWFNRRRMSARRAPRV
jgi:hypothetical protein